MHEDFEAIHAQFEAQCAAERKEVLGAGGLHILGTERHESRRIDNQLRGRAGRQGDPGKSRFYLSLEDDLMRIFAGDRVKSLMERMGMPDNEPIEHPWVTKSVENAQKKVEERNFDIRKNLLEYDDVMSAQRGTVYKLRQQLLAGGYVAEELDEEGKPTGEVREIKVSEEIAQGVRKDIAAMLGMFCDNPIMPHDKHGEPREIPREDFADNKLVEGDTLKAEIYQRWGVVVEMGNRAPLELYDHCLERIPLALTEQRERLLDLIDQIVGAIIEDSCPSNKPPDDWDWTAIFEGFEQHFGVELPEQVADYGDREALAREMYDLAEVKYLEKEKSVGLDLLLRIFRHLYLEEIDKSWVEHLTDMEHLRDGIGLRGYGQKDPKQEYKKEGYNMFVTLLARVSSNVLLKLMSAQVRGAEEEEAIEAEDLARHMDQLATAVASHGGQSQPLSSRRGAPPPEEPAVTGEMDCPCGSGKKFSACHGAELDDGNAA